MSVFVELGVAPCGTPSEDNRGGDRREFVETCWRRAQPSGRLGSSLGTPPAPSTCQGALADAAKHLEFAQEPPPVLSRLQDLEHSTTTFGIDNGNGMGLTGFLERFAVDSPPLAGTRFRNLDCTVLGRICAHGLRDTLGWRPAGSRHSIEEAQPLPRKRTAEANGRLNTGRILSPRCGYGLRPLQLRGITWMNTHSDTDWYPRPIPDFSSPHHAFQPPWMHRRCVGYGPL